MLLWAEPLSQTVKTRLQLQGALNKTRIVYRNGTIAAMGCADTVGFGLADCILQAAGPRRGTPGSLERLCTKRVLQLHLERLVPANRQLYNGSLCVLLDSRFGVYSTLNNVTGVAPQRDGAGVISWLNGSVAGGTAALIASPFALVRTQLQAQSKVSSFGHVHSSGSMKQVVAPHWQPPLAAV